MRQAVARALQDLTRRADESGLPAPNELDLRLAARPAADAELRKWTAEAIERGIQPLDQAGAQRLIDRVIEKVIYGVAGFRALLSWPNATDIFVHGNDPVRVRLDDGTEELAEPFVDSDAGLIDEIRRIAQHHGHQEREFNANAPLLELQLVDDTGVKVRVAAAAWLSPRPFMTIRRYMPVDIDLDDLYRRGEFDYGLRTLLGAIWRAGQNIVVTGPQGAGKTTLLRAIALDGPPNDRLIVVEDSPELQLGESKRLHHVEELVSRPPNSEGAGEVTLATLGRFVKRLQPDRIIVGEVRGAELTDMFEIMSQGVPGLATIHAKSADDMFDRLPLYAKNQPEGQPQLHASKAIDWVVVMGRDMHDRRVVAELKHVESYDREFKIVHSHGLFERHPHTGRAFPNPDSRMDNRLVEHLYHHGYRPDRHGEWAEG